MSIKLNELVDSLIETAPPVELKEVSKSLSTLTTTSIEDNIEKYAQENAVIIDSTIVSKYNKDSNSSKYIDYVNKKLFNVDWEKGKIIDVELGIPNVNYPTVYNDLVEKLIQYGEDYFPSSYAFTVIPNGANDDDDDKLRVIIIGQRANHENFYTGRWKSEYLISINNGDISGEIDLDIHYFEDGNVRLKFTEQITSNESQGKIDTSNASKIVNFINKEENQVVIKIAEQFNNLNQQSFKNLRRLLPVTRSKINWGSAIGNYRLGSDVVNKK